MTPLWRHLWPNYDILDFKILTQCVKMLGERVLQVWRWYLHRFRRYRKKMRGGARNSPPPSGARVKGCCIIAATDVLVWLQLRCVVCWLHCTRMFVSVWRHQTSINSFADVFVSAFVSFICRLREAFRRYLDANGTTLTSAGSEKGIDGNEKCRSRSEHKSCNKCH